MHSRITFYFSILVLSTFTLLNFGCGAKGPSESTFGSIADPSGSGSPSPSPTPTPGPGPAPVPTPTDDYDKANFYVSVEPGTRITSHLRKSTAFGDECAISKDSSSNEDIRCIIDIPEGELFSTNLPLRVNVPTGDMCAFTVVTPYYFFNREVGIGPTSIVVSVDQTTNASGDTTTINSYECFINGAISSDISCSGAGSTELSGLTLTANMGVTAIPTVAEQCVYNTTSGSCCFGSYSLTVLAHESTTGVTTVSSDSSKAWGGKFHNCIGGAAKTNWSDFTSAGEPKSLQFNSAVGLKNTFTITAPLNFVQTTSAGIPYKPLTDTRNMANYYDFNVPSVHRHTGFVSATTSDKPYFIEPIDDRSGDALPAANDAYEYLCLDQGFEVKHRIRVYVRDWDTYADYDNYITSEGVTEVPDRGNDPGSSCGEIFGLCNDAHDLDDFLLLDLGLLSYDTNITNVLNRGDYFPKINYKVVPEL